MRVFVVYSRCVLIFGLTVLAFAFESTGQATRTLNSAERRIESFNNQGSKAERDELDRESRGKKPSAEELKRAALLKAQLKEDLGALQDEYNTLVTKLKASEAISARDAAEAGDRVHLRSERLLKNLNLPDSKTSDVAEPAAYPTDTKRLLRSMCALIFQFITDPMFESPSALDVEAAGKARITLEKLIRLSDHISKLS